MPVAVTILEAAKHMGGDTVRRAIVEMFANSSDVMMSLPFMTIKGNAFKYNRSAQLPSVGFRGYNEAFSTSVGVINPVTESLFMCGGDLDVDKKMIDHFGAEIRSSQEEMQVTSIAEKWTQTFFKGDSDVEPREFDGLQKRIVGTQILTNSAASGGAALSLANLDAVIDNTWRPTHIIMNRTLKMRMIAAARAQGTTGFVTHGTDALGRVITQYAGLPILTGYDPSLNTAILPFDEVGSGGGSAVTCSIYVASLSENGLVGIQDGEIDARDLGEIDVKPVMRTRTDWSVGVAIMHGRSVSRLTSITNAAIVA